MQQNFSAKGQALNQSRRASPFMEPDSSLSWLQNARIELLHTVDVHLHCDFMTNFIFFFPCCILVSYAVSSKFCNLNVEQTVISTISRTCSSYFFPSFCSILYFTQRVGLFNLWQCIFIRIQAIWSISVANIIPCTLFSNTLSLYFSHYMMSKVTNAYKRTEKRVFYI
jgi:hypothetical protein